MKLISTEIKISDQGWKIIQAIVSILGGRLKHTIELDIEND